MTNLQSLLAGDVPRRAWSVDDDGETVHDAAWFETVPDETPQPAFVGWWLDS